jgi:hypothetical protein
MPTNFHLEDRLNRNVHFPKLVVGYTDTSQEMVATALDQALVQTFLLIYRSELELIHLLHALCSARRLNFMNSTF